MGELGIRLAETVRSLRAELYEAMDEGAGEQLRFRAGAVELEFEVAVTEGKEGEAGARFWVITAGGKASSANTATHRVKLTLTPQVQRGDADDPLDALIGDRVEGRPK